MTPEDIPRCAQGRRRSYLDGLLASTGRDPAPFLRRCGAAAVDLFLTAALGAPGIYLAVLALANDELRAPLGAAAAALILASTAFYLLHDAWGGAGPGKRVFGLRLVHLPTGATCSPVRVAARMAGSLVLAAFPYVGWAIDPAAVVVSGGGRRVVDVALDTQVVDGRAGMQR